MKKPQIAAFSTFVDIVSYSVISLLCPIVFMSYGVD